MAALTMHDDELQIPYYETTNPTLAGIGRRVLEKAPADSTRP